MGKIPKYAHLEYQVLHDLEISIQEYFMLDMVYRLSRSGWCNKKLDNIAFDMRLTKVGVTKMRNRLIERGYLKKGIGNRIATTEKVNKVYLLDESELEKSKLSYKKVNLVYPKSKQSIAKTPVENNKRITKNKKFYNSNSESPIGQVGTSTDSGVAIAKRRLYERLGRI